LPEGSEKPVFSLANAAKPGHFERDEWNTFETSGVALFMTLPGPVNALDHALRKALEEFYPQLKEVKLLDYKVRVLAANKGTGAKVRVLIESGDHKDKWGTVGVSENIIEATWQALADSIEYKLLKKE